VFVWSSKPELIVSSAPEAEPQTCSTSRRAPCPDPSPVTTSCQLSVLPDDPVPCAAIVRNWPPGPPEARLTRASTVKGVVSDGSSGLSAQVNTSPLAARKSAAWSFCPPSPAKLRGKAEPAPEAPSASC
jgi:hypothetical protein